MATRRQVRQSVVSLLYANDISGENQAFTEEFLEQRKIRNEQKLFALKLLVGVKSQCEKLDSLLQESVKEFEHLSKVECAILRLSTYELFFSDTAKAIIINEAIELAKQMGNENSSKLVNAVLDNLIKKNV